jgi:hypothetical protein
VLGVTSDFRDWFFCLAFLAIGLDSSFRDLGRHVTGGRPIQLYLAGQAFNLVLTLAAAYLAFGGILFDRIPVEATRGAPPAEFRQVIPRNLARDVEATALFYTEFDGWPRWADGARGAPVP